MSDITRSVKVLSSNFRLLKPLLRQGDTSERTIVLSGLASSRSQDNGSIHSKSVHETNPFEGKEFSFILRWSSRERERNTPNIFARRDRVFSCSFANVRHRVTEAEENVQRRRGWSLRNRTLP